MKRAAAGLEAERPAHRVGDLARLVVLGQHFPQLLHAEAEFLRLAARPTRLNLAMISLASEPRTPSAMSTYLPRSSMPGWKSGLRDAVLGDAEDAGDDAPDRSVVAIENLRTGEARIDLDAQRFRLRRPASGRHCRARPRSCRDCS